MGKETLTFGNIKIEKNINFTVIKVCFLEDVEYWSHINIPQDLFLQENCKYFIGYLCDDYEIKSLHIMFPKEARI